MLFTVEDLIKYGSTAYVSVRGPNGEFAQKEFEWDELAAQEVDFQSAEAAMVHRVQSAILDLGLEGDFAAAKAAIETQSYKVAGTPVSLLAAMGEAAMSPPPGRKKP